MADSKLNGRGSGLGRSRRPHMGVALSLLFLSGCYAYAEVSPAAVPPGRDVRLRLARGTEVSLGTIPVLDDGGPLEGQVVDGTTPERLLLSVALGPGQPGNVGLGLRSTVAIPMPDVARMEVRRLQRGRTAAAVGLGAVLAYAVTEWAFNVSNPGKEGGSPNGGDNALIAVFRLRWPSSILAPLAGRMMGLRRHGGHSGRTCGSGPRPRRVPRARWGSRPDGPAVGAVRRSSVVSRVDG